MASQKRSKWHILWLLKRKRILTHFSIIWNKIYYYYIHMRFNMYKHVMIYLSVSLLLWNIALSYYLNNNYNSTVFFWDIPVHTVRDHYDVLDDRRKLYLCHLINFHIEFVDKNNLRVIDPDKRAEYVLESFKRMNHLSKIDIEFVKSYISTLEDKLKTIIDENYRKNYPNGYFIQLNNINNIENIDKFIIRWNNANMDKMQPEKDEWL